MKKEEEPVQTKPLSTRIVPFLKRKAKEEKEEVDTPAQRKPYMGLMSYIRRKGDEEEKDELIQESAVQGQKEEGEQPVQTKRIQRQFNPEEEEEVQTKLQHQVDEEEKEAIQSKEVGPKSRIVAPTIESRIQSLKGGGRPLPKSIRYFFEPRFGADFSQVRLHTDSRAAETAKTINAKAFTKGKDVVFGAGQYSPGTSTGKHLIAHELTHILQQDPIMGKTLQQVTAPSIQRLCPFPLTGLTWSQRVNRARRMRGGRAMRACIHYLITQAIGNIRNINWTAAVLLARTAVNNRSTRNRGILLYRHLIVRAASKVRAPTPLIHRTPTIMDIHFSTSRRWTQFAAYTNPNLVVNYPNNYWRWIRFYPSVLMEEAWTVSAIFHELDHAAHYRTLYSLWNIRIGGRIRGRRKIIRWRRFVRRHEIRWIEQPIAVGGGLVTVMAGLPTTIRPSVIEFRAYANHFVNYFHKLDLNKQRFITSAMILHYPLRIQNVRRGIQDPAMNLRIARNRVISYFRRPPGNPQRQRLIRILVCDAFNRTIILRTHHDMNRIRRDFRDIYNSRLCRAVLRNRNLARNAASRYRPTTPI